jgi:transcriptional regulator with XRE-family HTH domain
MYYRSSWGDCQLGIELRAESVGTRGMLEPAQIRAARALLGWRQEDLSKASGVGTATIQRIEKSDPPVTGYVSTVLRIQAAFEDAGILFIGDDDTAGIGLRLAKRRSKRR